ncbi:MAG: 4Fe-4S dicluster domain-containing protein [Gemmatimonadales bacterium]
MRLGLSPDGVHGVLFRPSERLIEGGRSGTLALDRQKGFKPRRLLKYFVFLLLALFLAHTFLAYFCRDRPPRRVGSAVAVRASDRILHHGLSTTAAIMFDFTYPGADPSGRLSLRPTPIRSARPKSLIVGYDTGRGEPRAKGAKRPDGVGDCIDCNACVLTCPTGIDIRDGLQMSRSLHPCADACDEIMDKVGKPRGLIRYTSRDERSTASRRSSSAPGWSSIRWP